MVVFALSHGVALHPRNLTKHSGHDSIKLSRSTLRGGHSRLLVITLVRILHSKAKKTTLTVIYNSFLSQLNKCKVVPQLNRLQFLLYIVF